VEPAIRVYGRGPNTVLRPPPGRWGVAERSAAVAAGVRGWMVTLTLPSTRVTFYFTIVAAAPRTRSEARRRVAASDHNEGAHGFWVTSKKRLPPLEAGLALLLGV